MRILIVSWYFPPANTIGAVRIGAMARALAGMGHDVRVLAGKDLPFPRTLPVPIPESHVTRAPWWDINRVPDQAVARLRAILRRSGSQPEASPAASAAIGAPAGDGGTQMTKRLRRYLSELYVDATNIPDARIGWYGAAVRAGRELLRSWRPDVIYASGPPFTGLLIGNRLSRWSGVPLVCELRDRWSDDPYYPAPAWRQIVESVMERRVLGRAIGLVTVSDPWAATYRMRFGKPVEVVQNGYDPEYGADPAPTAGGDTLRIVYTGGIYPGRRDPSPLFAAMALLGGQAAGVQVEFYGTDPDLVLPLAAQHGVVGAVTVQPMVTHAEAVALQRSGDVLLLMQWSDPREQGNVPGKFFEYLGARRPILLLGLAGGVPDTIIRAREAGFSSTDPQAIAGQLAAWVAAKRAGGVPATPAAAAAGFQRDEQFARIPPFLEQLLEAPARPVGVLTAPG